MWTHSLGFGKVHKEGRSGMLSKHDDLNDENLIKEKKKKIGMMNMHAKIKKKISNSY
jgi:hypothetical protein